MDTYDDDDEPRVKSDFDLQAHQERTAWRPRPKPTTIAEVIAEQRAVAERNKRAKEVRAIMARRRKRQEKKLEDKWKKLREIQNKNKRRNH